MKKAFTLIEIIMVMVILGILATVGVNLVATMYKDYVRTRAINYLEAQTEITLEQISNRFSKRIISSSRAYKLGGVKKKLALANADDNIIEWIGTSYESMLNGWSGFIDLKDPATTVSKYKTLGSKLTYANEIIKKLSYGSINENTAALVFKSNHLINLDNFYESATAVSPRRELIEVKFNSDDELENVNPAQTPFGKRIYAQYYLAHTAYALVPDTTGGNENDFTLTLKYNYQPWNGETYADGKTSILARHVQKFRIKQQDGVARMVLCMQDNALRDDKGEYVKICKEKAVLRWEKVLA